MSRVSVIGAGAWGTTLSQVLADAGNEVLLWARNQAVVDEINSSHTNEKYLAGIKLPSTIKSTSDIQSALSFSELYVLAIPTQQLRQMLKEWAIFLNKEAIVVSTLKGIELDTDLRIGRAHV